MTRVMEEFKGIENFSLLGGPLYQLGCRLGLVRDETHTLRIGLSLGLFLWVILIALTFYAGFSYLILTLQLLGVHVRLLIVIPLMFLAESWLAPRWTTFVSIITGSGVVPQEELHALDVEIKRILRWKDSWLPEAVCLVLAVVLSAFGSDLPLPGASVAADSSRVMYGSVAAWWYWIVCMPLFRFLVLRWALRLGLWTYFLWRVSKLELNLVPTHPDSAAGLGYLEVVHFHFTPLILAISALQAASFTEEITEQTMSLESVYPAVALILIIDAVMFLGPLFVFSAKLWACQIKGLRDYMDLGETYVRAFDRKWVHTQTAPDEPLLGSADIQSLADLTNSINNVRSMRWVPVGKKLLIGYAVAALAPIVPLLLLKYPLAELIQKFFSNLTGM